MPSFNNSASPEGGSTNEAILIDDDTPVSESRGGVMVKSSSPPVADWDDLARRQNPITIDKRGDLRLIVGEKRRVFVVDSRALARSSPVWAQQIYGSSDAPTGLDALDPDDKDWQVELDLELRQYEEKVETLKVLLYAAHGRLDRIPAKPSLSDLCFILILSNKFEMMPVMGGHIQTWYAQMRSSSNGLRIRCLTELRITWEYGYEPDFQRAANVFVWYAKVDDDGHLFRVQHPSKSTWLLEEDDAIMVTGIYDAIKKRRTDIIQNALRNLQAKLRILQGPKAGSKRRHESSIPTACTQGRRSEECDAYHLGLLIRALVAEGFTPHALPTAQAINESLDEFDARMTRIYDAIETCQTLAGKSHSKCNPVEPIVTKMKEQRDAHELTLTDWHREHFKKQTATRGKKNNG